MALIQRRGRPGLGSPDRLTVAIGAVAAAATVAVFAIEVGRVWRRGSAPLPREADSILEAAESAVAETVEVAVAGYQEVSTRENALFNMFASFVLTFGLARATTYLLRNRKTVGPFRNLQIGGQRIHHFIPGIVLAFAAGGGAIATRNEDIEPTLAVPFGIGMGLTLDESALLLELEDVYWTERGLVSVQVTLAVTALLGAVALAANFLRRGEKVVLNEGEAPAGAPAGHAEASG
jgi:hypothetical protein